MGRRRACAAECLYQTRGFCDGSRHMPPRPLGCRWLFQDQFTRGVPVITVSYSLRWLRRLRRWIVVTARRCVGGGLPLSVLLCKVDGHRVTGSAAPFQQLFRLESGRFRLSEGGRFPFPMKSPNDQAATASRAIPIRPLSSQPRELLVRIRCSKTPATHSSQRAQPPQRRSAP